MAHLYTRELIGLGWEEVGLNHAGMGADRQGAGGGGEWLGTPGSPGHKVQ